MNQIDEKLKILIFSNKYQTMIEQIYMIFNIKVAKKELENKQILTEVSTLYYNSI